MYKVNGMLVENNSYNGKAGATYYANYNDGQLIVLKNDKGYAFNDKEVAFTYNEAEKTFTAAPIKFGYKYDNADMKNGGYIGGYKAVVKVEEPEVDNGALDAFVGTWNESFNYVSWNGATPCEGTFEVTVEDGKLLFTGMFNMVQYGTAYKGNYYGELSADGTKVLLSDASSNGHGMLGPIMDSSYKPTTLEVTVQDGKLVFAKGFNGYVENYVAAKKVNPLLAFLGTWNESFNYVSWNGATPCEGTFEVTEEDGKLLFTGMFNMVQYGTAYKGNYYGELSADGTKVLLSDASSNGHGMLGPIMDSSYKPTTLEVTVEDGKLVFATGFNGYVENYVATKPGAVEPEPEQPTRQPNDSWENAAVVVNGPESTSDSKLKELKVYADADYLYVRLTAENAAPFGANYFDIYFTDGEGETEVWWGWSTTGTKIYYQEHKNELDANGNITKMRWYTDPETRVYINDYTTTSSDTEVVWEIKYPRSYVDVYKSSTDTLHVSVLLWNGWDEYWAIPSRNESEMLEVVLP